VPELTKAYFAIEGVLRSPLISPTTREKFEGFLTQLDIEIAEAIKNQIHDTDSDMAAD
jgi:hypothetical protein